MKCDNTRFLIKDNLQLKAGQQLVLNKLTGNLSVGAPPAEGKGFIGLILRVVRCFYRAIYTVDQIKVLNKVEAVLQGLSKEQAYYQKNKIALSQNFTVIKNAAVHVDSSEAVASKIKAIEAKYFPQPSEANTERSQEDSGCEERQEIPVSKAVLRERTEEASERAETILGDEGYYFSDGTDSIPALDFASCVSPGKTSAALYEQLSVFLSGIPLADWVDLAEASRVDAFIKRFAKEFYGNSSNNIINLYITLNGSKDFSISDKVNQDLKYIALQLSQRLDEILSDDASEKRKDILKASGATLQDLFSFPYDYSPLRFVGREETLETLTHQHLVPFDLKQTEKSKIHAAGLGIIAKELYRVLTLQKDPDTAGAIEWPGKENALEMELLKFRQLSIADIALHIKDIPPEALAVLRTGSLENVKMEELSAEKFQIIAKYHPDYFKKFKAAEVPQLIMRFRAVPEVNWVQVFSKLEKSEVKALDLTDKAFDREMILALFPFHLYQQQAQTQTPKLGQGAPSFGPGSARGRGRGGKPLGFAKPTLSHKPAVMGSKPQAVPLINQICDTRWNQLDDDQFLRLLSQLSYWNKGEAIPGLTGQEFPLFYRAVERVCDKDKPLLEKLYNENKVDEFHTLFGPQAPAIPNAVGKFSLDNKFPALIPTGEPFKAAIKLWIAAEKQKNTWFKFPCYITEPQVASLKKGDFEELAALSLSQDAFSRIFEGVVSRFAALDNEAIAWALEFMTPETFAKVLKLAQDEDTAKILSKLEDSQAIKRYFHLCCKSGKYALLACLKPEQMQGLQVSDLEQMCAENPHGKQDILKALLSPGAKVSALSEDLLTYALEQMDATSYDKVFGNSPEPWQGIKTKAQAKLVMQNGPLDKATFVRWITPELCNLLEPEDFDALALKANKLYHLFANKTCGFTHQRLKGLKSSLLFWVLNNVDKGNFCQMFSCSVGISWDPKPDAETAAIVARLTSPELLKLFMAKCEAFNHSAPFRFLSVEQLKTIKALSDDPEADMGNQLQKLFCAQYKNGEEGAFARLNNLKAAGLLEWALRTMTKQTFVALASGMYTKADLSVYALLDTKEAVFAALQTIKENDTNIIELFYPFTPYQLALLSKEEYQALQLTPDQLRYLFAWIGSHTGCPGINKANNLQRFLALDKDTLAWLLQSMDKATVNTLFYSVSWDNADNTSKAEAKLKEYGLEVPAKQ